MTRKRRGKAKGKATPLTDLALSDPAFRSLQALADEVTRTGGIDRPQAVIVWLAPPKASTPPAWESRGLGVHIKTATPEDPLERAFALPAAEPAEATPPPNVVKPTEPAPLYLADPLHHDENEVRDAIAFVDRKRRTERRVKLDFNFLTWRRERGWE